MRFYPLFLVICLASAASLNSGQAAPAPSPAPAPTTSSAAAEAGKDVVHQLNNAFAKVFESVAPAVVIIEITKKNEGLEPTLEDLFGGPQPDDTRMPVPQNNLPVQ